VTSPVPNAVTIWQVAQDLASHGYAATEAVSTSLEAETGERCNANGDLTLGWSDLRTLQSQYGWTITARGNGDDRTLSTAQQTADSCDLLPTFVSEGFNDAWSMYSYFGGPYSLAMQTNVVAPCFAFGRTYSIGSNPLPVPSPYLVKVDSINGGNCANTALPCSKFGFTYTYTQPSALAALVQSAGWNIIQGYKFVTGSNATDSVSGVVAFNDPDLNDRPTPNAIDATTQTVAAQAVTQTAAADAPLRKAANVRYPTMTAPQATTSRTMPANPAY